MYILGVNAAHRESELIFAFQDMTGLPMVVNASFNDNESIVYTPEKAIETFRGTRIDVLAVDDFVVDGAS